MSRSQRPHHGYSDAVAIEAPSGFQAVAQWGGLHDRLHVFASGSGGQDLAVILRKYYPAHRVTRADVCIDFVDQGSFEKLEGLCRKVADEHRLKRRKIDDDGQGNDGATYYLGAPSSNVRTRLYEKGKQMFTPGVKHAGPVVLPEGLTDDHSVWDWSRLEVQVRPEGAAREKLATAEPAAFWGASKWTQQLVRCALELNIERVKVGKIWRPSDDERAYRFMVSQYGAMLARYAHALGGWDCLGHTIGNDVRELARKKARRQA